MGVLPVLLKHLREVSLCELLHTGEVRESELLELLLLSWRFAREEHPGELVPLELRLFQTHDGIGPKRHLLGFALELVAVTPQGSPRAYHLKSKSSAITDGIAFFMRL
jgi:hypothetical protein